MLALRLLDRVQVAAKLSQHRQQQQAGDHCHQQQHGQQGEHPDGGHHCSHASGELLTPTPWPPPGKLFHSSEFEHRAQQAGRMREVLDPPALQLKKHGCIRHETHRRQHSQTDAERAVCDSHPTSISAPSRLRSRPFHFLIIQG